MRRAEIYIFGRQAGILEEHDQGYRFSYSSEYVSSAGAMPVSLSLPLQNEPYEDKRLFPFFDGLIPLEDGQRAFITRRMDRPDGNKLHMEDLCQLTDRLTEQKYRSSMEQAGRAVLRYCSNPLFEALRLFDLTVFCFLTGNADMHLKNFSLLYAPGREIRLAPAYDLLPSVLLLPEDPEETALTLNGKKRNLRPEDFLKFGAALQLTERQIQNSLRRISTAMDSGLALIERGFCSGEMKVRYRALISERSARLFG